MKPYFEQAGIAVYLGDCREVVPQLALDDVDLVLADPPYGTTSLKWDDREIARWVLRNVRGRNTAPLWCWGPFRMFLDLPDDIHEGGWRYAQEIVWEKQNGSNFADDRFRRVHDLCVQFWQKDVRWSAIYKQPQVTSDATARQVRRKLRPKHLGNVGTGHYTSEDGGPRLMRSVMYAPNCHGFADNPTQKPLEVLRPIIEYSCPPGGLVLDPTCGAGSTLVAAKETGRSAIGIDNDEAQCEAAARRLVQTMALPAPAAIEGSR